MIGIVAAASIESFLTDALIWGVFSLLFLVIVTFPAVTTRDWTTTVPWPLLLVGTAAVLARAVGVYATAAGYIAIATLAITVVVELDVFTSVELGRRFAVVFGTLTTMAVEALWIVAQFYSDRLLGTDFLGSQTDLQKDIVTVTAIGFAMGGLFYWYFARGEPAETVERLAEF